MSTGTIPLKESIDPNYNPPSNGGPVSDLYYQYTAVATVSAGGVTSVSVYQARTDQTGTTVYSARALIATASPVVGSPGVFLSTTDAGKNCPFPLDTGGPYTTYVYVSCGSEASVSVAGNVLEFFPACNLYISLITPAVCPPPSVSAPVVLSVSDNLGGKAVLPYTPLCPAYVAPRALVAGGDLRAGADVFPRSTFLWHTRHVRLPINFSATVDRGENSSNRSAGRCGRAAVPAHWRLRPRDLLHPCLRSSPILSHRSRACPSMDPRVCSTANPRKKALDR